MLPRPRFGYHPTLAHTDGKQRLTERVVDLVRPGVGEVLTLEQQARAAKLFRPAQCL